MDSAFTPTKIAAVVLALGGFVLIGQPVFEALMRNDGSLQAMMPRLAGIMAYAIAAPIVLMAAVTGAVRLVGVALCLAGAFAVEWLTLLFESGRLLEGFAGIVAVIAFGLVLAHVNRRRDMARAARTEQLARDSVREVKRVLARQKVRFAGNATDPDAPLHSIILVENLIPGAVWEAAASGDPEVFAETVQRRLAEISLNLCFNKRADPYGHGANAAALCLRAVQTLLDDSGLGHIRPDLKREEEALKAPEAGDNDARGAQHVSFSAV